VENGLHHKNKRLPALFLLLAVTCGPASAATIDFYLGTNGNTTHQNSGSGMTNTRTYQSNGLFVTVTGWSVTGGAQNNQFERAQVGRYSTGLGICNSDEGSNCSDPAHQVDNVGQLEYIMLTFSAPISQLGVIIDPYNTWDRDVTYYVGSQMALGDITGLQESALTANGYFGPLHSNSTMSSASRQVDLNFASTGGFTTRVLFGARNYMNNPDSDADRFKMWALLATPYNVPGDFGDVPEPSTYALIGAGLGGLMLYRRRVA
jgi:hypothetical protein